MGEGWMIPRFGEEEYVNVNRAMRDGKLSEYWKNPLGGPWVQEFERRFAEYHKMPYAVACSNGTSALHIALEAYLCDHRNTATAQPWSAAGLLELAKLPEEQREEIKDAAAWVMRSSEREKICVSPYSFIASASCALMAGAEPFFTDIDSETWTIPDRHSHGAGIPKDIRIIIPVHLLGHPCDIRHIKQSDTWDYIVEDTAQALGSRVDGELCGTLGDISTYSFQYTKTITTMGEGGIVLTRDPVLYDRCLKIRSHGSQYADTPYQTYNYRMIEPQAAFGCAQMNRLNGFLSIQRRNAEYIISHLPKGLKPPEVLGNVQHSWFLIGCVFDEQEAGMSREQFIERCTQEGVSKGQPGANIGAGYSKPLYRFPLLKPYAPTKPLEHVENIVKKSVFLDIHRWDTLESVKEKIEKMTKILEASEK